MARKPYVDPEARAEIDRIRQEYREKVQSGQLKYPEHDYSKFERQETPTPGQKARMEAGLSANRVNKTPEFGADGGILPPAPTKEILDSAAARSHTKTGEISRGALVEEDVAAPTIDTEDSIPTNINQSGKSDGGNDGDGKSDGGQDSPIEIPEDWEELPWDQLRPLAKNFSDKTITNKEAALAAIREEIERRNSE